MTRNFASRLRQWRIKAYKTEEEMASVIGVALNEYRDLESYDDEFTSNLALGKILRLGRALGLDAATLLAGEVTQSLSVQELQAAIQHHLGKHRLTVEGFADEVGWDVAEMLHDAAAVEDWCIDQLSDVCKSLGVDPVNVLAGVL